MVAVGGSATTDGGAGALEAIEAGGGLRGAQIVVVCDVASPFERAPRSSGPRRARTPTWSCGCASASTSWPRRSRATRAACR